MLPIWRRFTWSPPLLPHWDWPKSTGYVGRGFSSVVRLYGLVPGYPCDAKPFHITGAASAILIDHVVNGTLVLLLKDGHMNDILGDKSLCIHLGDHHLAIFGKDDYIVNITTIRNVFIPPQRGTLQSLPPCSHRALYFGSPLWWPLYHRKSLFPICVLYLCHISF